MEILITEQKAFQHRRHYLQELGEDFQNMFKSAANLQDEQLIMGLADMFAHTPESASTIVSMAKAYKKLDVRVDLRMEAGRSYLLFIADDTLKAMDGESHYIKSSLKQEGAGVVFTPIISLTKEQLNDEEVIKLIALGFRREHPTLQQTFLRCMLTAAKHAVNDESSFDLRKIASYAQPLPYI